MDERDSILKEYHDIMESKRKDVPSNPEDISGCEWHILWEVEGIIISLTNELEQMKKALEEERERNRLIIEAVKAGEKIDYFYSRNYMSEIGMAPPTEEKKDCNHITISYIKSDCGYFTSITPHINKFCPECGKKLEE